MSASNYMENAILDTLRNQPLAFAAVYVKLHTGDPGEDGIANAATEATRQAVTFSAASGGSISANSQPSWTNVAAQETYTHFSLWDAETDGNCIGSGALNAPAAVEAGDNFTLTALTGTAT